MRYLMKRSGEIEMTSENNQLLDQMRSIDSNLVKLEKNSNKNSDQVGLIWLTLICYILYIEFFFAVKLKHIDGQMQKIHYNEFRE